MQRARELARVSTGDRVRMRGAPGLGTGLVRELSALNEQGNPCHGFMRVLVVWPGLDEGRPYDLIVWERSSDLRVMP